MKLFVSSAAQSGRKQKHFTELNSCCCFLYKFHWRS